MTVFKNFIHKYHNSNYQVKTAYPKENCFDVHDRQSSITDLLITMYLFSVELYVLGPYAQNKLDQV